MGSHNKTLPIGIGVLAVILAGTLIFMAATQNKTYEQQGSELQLKTNDLQYVWQYDWTEDMQLPELPNGSEATACSTLLRMYNVPVSKLDIAEILPNGKSIAPSDIAGAANDIFGRSGYRAETRIGVDLDDLRLPCEIWVTRYIEEPKWLIYQGRYVISDINQAIVLISLDEDEAHIVDPLVGELHCDRSLLEKRYEQIGMQAVVIYRPNE